MKEDMKECTLSDLHKVEDSLKIVMFNVGQGDHLLLRFPNREYGIIDFYYDNSPRSVEPPSLTYFKALKEANPEEDVVISFFCLSHTDADHVKGASDSLDWFLKHRVMVRNIWLGAARDQRQLSEYLRKKIAAIIEKLPVEEQLMYTKYLDTFDDSLKPFFDNIDRWRNREFEVPPSFDVKGLGLVEYLVDIRGLRMPCPQISAICIGPLNDDLDGFIKSVDLDTVRKIIGFRKGSPVDKNFMSHILRLSFNNRSLLFGGDTHKEIWERALAVFHDDSYEHKKHHGHVASDFIKVSHHGSKRSSSKAIWDIIIPESGKIFLGISAGRHKKFRHPSSETLGQLRSRRSDACILSTNICAKCLDSCTYPKAWHRWYDDYIEKHYGKDHKHIMVDSNIAEGINAFFSVNRQTNEPQTSMGLLAYVINIPSDAKEEVTASVAYSKFRVRHDCFYSEHKNRLSQSCSVQGGVSPS